MSGVLSDGPGRPESGEEYWRRAFYETDADLQRYKDALKIAEEILTRFSRGNVRHGGVIFDAEQALATIQAAKEVAPIVTPKKE